MMTCAQNSFCQQHLDGRNLSLRLEIAFGAHAQHELRLHCLRMQIWRVLVDCAVERGRRGGVEHDNAAVQTKNAARKKLNGRAQFD